MITFLSREVSIQSLVFFRLFFGSMMLWESCKYISSGNIIRFWVIPEFNFTYGGFSWITPVEGQYMVLLFYIMGALSVCIMAGFLYRFTSALLFLLFSYIFLLEQARYLNHFYLIALICALLPFIPAHRAYSVDALLFPKIKTLEIPFWPVFLLQFQTGIVYFFGGIAKINPDWLRGYPLTEWLPPRHHLFPYIGQFFHTTEFALFISYSGLFIDLLAYPLLLLRRTRPFMLPALALFHLVNDRLFLIGVFPWFMTGALLLFYPTSWPSMFLAYVKKSGVPLRTAFLLISLTGGIIASLFHGSFSAVPFLCGILVFPLMAWDLISSWGKKKQTNDHDVNLSQSRISPVTATGILIWCIFQILVPLRHFLIPGNPSWTEEGHRFSWHMKLRSKRCNATFFTVNDENPEPVRLGIPNIQHWQYRKMTGRPNLILQYAKHLSKLHDGIPVYAEVYCSLNQHPMKLLIDPGTDLTKVEFHDYKKNDWILRYE